MTRPFFGIQQTKAGVGYMFHRSTDGWQQARSWMLLSLGPAFPSPFQVLAPESLSHRQRPCERRAGLGLRWVYAASDHGNAA